ncbi:MAG: regulatory protein RecX [Ginsengibacter sp.]|jgi:regulatory protein
MRITFTPDQALPKIKQFCAYQERCHSEVKDKLFSFGLTVFEVNSILSELINENYLNEERFAKLFAGGKFRIKQWGRNKIKQHLKFKQVSEYCIKKGLQEIDEDDYQKVFLKLMEQKLKTIKSEKNIFIKKRKLKDFLVQRGFENDLIHEALRKL